MATVTRNPFTFGGGHPTSDRLAAPIEVGLVGDVGLDNGKAAYRKLALLLHPDKGGTAEDLTRIETAFRKALLIFSARKRGCPPPVQPVEGSFRAETKMTFESTCEPETTR